jgi:hypothetical protein
MVCETQHVATLHNLCPCSLCLSLIFYELGQIYHAKSDQLMQRPNEKKPIVMDK